MLYGWPSFTTYFNSLIVIFSQKSDLQQHQLFIISFLYYRERCRPTYFMEKARSNVCVSVYVYVYV